MDNTEAVLLFAVAGCVLLIALPVAVACLFIGRGWGQREERAKAVAWGRGLIGQGHRVADELTAVLRGRK